MKKAKRLLSLVLIVALFACSAAGYSSAQAEEPDYAVLSQMAMEKQQEWVLVVPGALYSGSELNLKLTFDEQSGNQQPTTDEQSGSASKETGKTEKKGKKKHNKEESQKEMASAVSEAQDDTVKAANVEGVQLGDMAGTSQAPDGTEQAETAGEQTNAEGSQAAGSQTSAEGSQAAGSQTSAEGSQAAGSQASAEGSQAAGSQASAEGSQAADAGAESTAEPETEKQKKKKENSRGVVMTLRKDDYKENRNDKRGYLAYRVRKDGYLCYVYVLQSLREEQIAEATLSAVSVKGEKRTETAVALHLKGELAITADDLKEDSSEFIVIVIVIAAVVLLLIVAVVLYLMSRNRSGGRRDGFGHAEEPGYELRVYLPRECDVLVYQLTDRRSLDLWNGEDANGNLLQSYLTRGSSGITELRAELNRREGAVTVTIRQSEELRHYVMNEEHRLAVVPRPNGHNEELLRLFFVC